MKIMIFAILVVSAFFGCVENHFKGKDVAFDLKSAGIETKYQVREEVASNGTVVGSKDILITVTRRSCTS